MFFHSRDSTGWVLSQQHVQRSIAFKLTDTCTCQSKLDFMHVLLSICLILHVLWKDTFIIVRDLLENIPVFCTLST